MKLTRILKSRRGAAVETAIVFLISIFAICALLTVIALTGNAQMQLENTLLSSKVEVEQIGEDYLAALKAGKEIPSAEYKVGKYSAQVSDDGVLTVENSKGTVLLYVDATAKNVGSDEAPDYNVTVNKWCYTEPGTQE